MKSKSTKTIKETTVKKTIYVLVSIVATAILFVSYGLIKDNSLRKQNEECIISKIYSFNDAELIKYHNDSSDCLSHVINEKFSFSAILHNLIDNFAGTQGIYKHDSGECFQQLMSTSETLKNKYSEIGQSCYKEIYGEEKYENIKELAEEIKKDFQVKE